MNPQILRILDANLNRLREALRVLEEVPRFSRNDAAGCRRLKGLRHGLLAAEALLDRGALLAARDAARDAGRTAEGGGEFARGGERDLLAANLRRGQEAARVLEEAGKVVSADFARRAKELRYELYELEREALLSWTFPRPCLYVLLTRSLCRLDPAEVLRRTLAGGADIVQVREKEMEDGELLRWLEDVRAVMAGSRARLVINDRIHLMRLAGADGVHLGQGDLPTARARELMHPGQVLGRSTHCLEQALAAEAEGADYIGVGPLFPTDTKVHRGAVGLEYLRQVQEGTRVPYVAIGAVNRGSIARVMACRPTGLAICTGIIGAEDPEAETVFYRRQLDDASRP